MTKKIKINHAEQCVNDLEVSLIKNAVNPFVGIKLFSDNADKELKLAQQSSSEALYLRARAFNVMGNIKIKITEEKMRLGILLLEEEKRMAEVWIEETEQFLNALDNPKQKEIPTLSNMNDAKHFDVYFASISDEHKNELMLKILEGKEKLSKIMLEIERLSSVGSVDISDEFINVIESLLPGYKFVS